MKGSQGITTDVNICFISYEMIKTHMIKETGGIVWKSPLLNGCISAALFIMF